MNNTSNIKTFVNFSKKNFQDKKVLLIAKADSSYESICGLISLKLLMEQELNSEVDIAFEKDPAGRIKDLLNQNNVDYKTSLQKPKYIIRINYGDSPETEIDKIKWEADDQNVFLFITPIKGPFDFDRVHFDQVGTAYESIVTVGVDNLDSLGKLYSENQYLFEIVEKITINNSEEEDLEGDVVLNNPEKGISEIVVEILKEIGFEGNSDSQVVRLLTQGCLAYLDIRKPGSMPKYIMHSLSDLVELGGNVKTAYQGLYSNEEMDLEEEAEEMSNQQEEKTLTVEPTGKESPEAENPEKASKESPSDDKSEGQRGLITPPPVDESDED
jgi:hypothetical protein